MTGHQGNTVLEEDQPEDDEQQVIDILGLWNAERDPPEDDERENVANTKYTL